MLAAPPLAFSHEGDHEFELPPIQEDFSLADNASSCTPDEEFDLCYEIDLANPEYWQDQGGSDPDWRTVEVAPEELGVDYVVTLHTKALNGGIVPTATGQGEYDNMDALIDTYSEFIGVNIRDNTYILLTSGSSAKLGHGGTPASVHYGIFVYDALSNDEGKVIIDGEDRTADFIDRTRTQQADFHEIHADGTTQQIDNNAEILLSDDSTTSTQSMIDSSQITTYSIFPGRLLYPDVHDLTGVYADGYASSEWTGQLRASHTPQSDDHTHFTFELSMMERHGDRCGWTFDFSAKFPSVEWECFETRSNLWAYHLDSENEPVDDFFYESQSTELASISWSVVSKADNFEDEKFCVDGWIYLDNDGRGRVTSNGAEPEDCPPPHIW